MRWMLIGTVVSLGLFLAVCGGGSGERVLHLNGFDMSESDFKAHVRRTLIDNPGWVDTCKGLQGLSPKEMLGVVEANGPPTGTATVPPKAIPVPGQAAAPEDKERVTAIYKAECERLLR